MYALIVNNKVAQLSEIMFPVHKNFKWAEVDVKDEVKENFLYVDGVFSVPAPEIKPVAQLDPINNLIQAIYLYLSGTIGLKSVDDAYENAKVDLNKTK